MNRGGGRGGYNSNSSGGRGASNYRNPCLTMHQPWASLLIYGIKRIEGRSWPSPITGRLWIHAASKIPDQETIKAMEIFYREIYAVNGITDIKFPEHYPVSRLLGCVEVTGCLKCEELVSWDAVPESVRLEGLTDFCWLCEKPKKLAVPFEMRGYQGVYNLERRIYEAAMRGLCEVEGPQPVKFPLPNPRDPYSLRPGALISDSHSNATVEKSESVNSAIAGARAAATQFSKKDSMKLPFESQSREISNFQMRKKVESSQNVSTCVDSESLPNSLSPYLLRARSLSSDSTTKPEVENSESVNSAVAGEGSGAAQFSKNNTLESQSEDLQTNKKVENSRNVSISVNNESLHSSSKIDNVSQQNLVGSRGFRSQSGVYSSKLFAAAVKGLALE